MANDGDYNALYLLSIFLRDSYVQDLCTLWKPMKGLDMK